METLSYSSIIERIFQLPKSVQGSASFEDMMQLCQYLGSPQIAYPTIHVAGTNGKGSVCTKMAAALQQQGYRCALYTSPHISSFCERIQINGVFISEAEVCKLYPQVMDAIEACSTSASFFEIATLLAFLYFREQKVEIAVIETGIGGLYDATNVIYPLVSIITSIGYDHQELLGYSLQEICNAKAGIIKRGKPLVLGPTVPPEWLEPVAQKQKSHLYQSHFAGEDYDRENQEIARLALETISEDFPIEKSALAEGLQVRPPCRFEPYLREKVVILDVAHNPQGFARLIDRLKVSYPGASYRFVCGFSQGKEIGAIAKLLQRQASTIHLVSGAHPRLASIEEIASYFDSNKTPLIQECSIAQGIRHACQAESQRLEIVIVTGTFFIMHEARMALEKLS